MITTGAWRESVCERGGRERERETAREVGREIK